MDCHQPIPRDGLKDIFGKKVSRDLILRLHTRNLIATGSRSPRAWRALSHTPQGAKQMHNPAFQNGVLLRQDGVETAFRFQRLIKIGKRLAAWLQSPSTLIGRQRPQPFSKFLRLQFALCQKDDAIAGFFGFK